MVVQVFLMATTCKTQFKKMVFASTRKQKIRDHKKHLEGEDTITRTQLET